jgi:hypothetical protein
MARKPKLILCRNCATGAVKVCSNCKSANPDPRLCRCSAAPCTCRWEGE